MDHFPYVSTLAVAVEEILASGRRWADGILLIGAGLIGGTVFGVLVAVDAAVVRAATENLTYFVIFGVMVGLTLGLLAGVLSGALYVIFPIRFTRWRIFALVVGPLISSALAYFAVLQSSRETSGLLVASIATGVGSTSFILLMRSRSRRYQSWRKM